MWTIVIALLVISERALSVSSVNEKHTAPQLPRQFQLSLESINVFTNKVQSVKQYYDFSNNSYRIDMLNAKQDNESMKLGEGPFTKIINFTSGISNSYSPLTKLCAKYPSPSCEPRLVDTSSDKNWQLMTSCGILSLYEDSNVTKVYAGNQTVRNTLCDVWTSTRKNWPENRAGELVLKWFFLRNPWTYSNQEQIPLQLEVDGQVAWNTTVNATIVIRISFFAFESNYWTDDAFKVPDYCMSSGGDDEDDHAGSETAKMYTRKHVAQIATLVGIICIVISVVGCGFYNFCKMRRSHRKRFF